ncbi:hypothetical protein L218DRAFT_818149, partial [Marasmius fiardii PR-910]
SRRPLFLTRNERGSGYGNRGDNLQTGQDPHAEGQPINEYLTINQFWSQVVGDVNMNDGFPIPQDWSIGLYLNGRLLPQTDELVTTVW